MAQSNGFKVRCSREPGGSKRGEVIRTLLMNGRAAEFSGDDCHMIDFTMASLSDTILQSGIGSSELADKVFKLSSQQELTADLELTLFIMARIIHFEEVIKPYIFGETDEDCIILDRFWPSTFAYQIFTRTRQIHDKAMIDFFNRIFDWHLEYLYGFFVQPEVIILDVDPEIGLSRIGMRPGKLTAFDQEQLPFHQAVRQGYWDLVYHSRLEHPMPRYRASIHLVNATPEIDVVFESVKKIITKRIELNSVNSSHLA